MLISQADPCEYLIGLVLEPDSLTPMRESQIISSAGRVLERQPITSNYYTHQHSRAGSGSLDNKMRASFQ